MQRHLPNFITLLNLFTGCCAVLFAFYEQYHIVFWLVFLAFLLDFADGFVARLLKVHSPLGKELDSMADMISFGFVPGVILYKLLATNFEIAEEGVIWQALPAFLVTVLSGLRLAKFNLDTRQSDSFIGLPTPSSTAFVLGIMLIYADNTLGLADFVSHPWFLYPTILILAYLLVAEIPMFALKFKNFGWKGNELKYLTMLGSIVLLYFIGGAAFAPMVFLYVLVALVKLVLG